MVTKARGRPGAAHSAEAGRAAGRSELQPVGTSPTEEVTGLAPPRARRWRCFSRFPVKTETPKCKPSQLRHEPRSPAVTMALLSLGLPWRTWGKAETRPSFPGGAVSPPSLPVTQTAICEAPSRMVTPLTPESQLQGWRGHVRGHYGICRSGNATRLKVPVPYQPGPRPCDG